MKPSFQLRTNISGCRLRRGSRRRERFASVQGAVAGCRYLITPDRS
jgi:hypothetical protein